MAARMAVTAGIAGTAVIVSGIVGVVTLTDLNARADNAGARVSVAKIDVVAPSRPTPLPVTASDSDIPAPATPETVPAPEPRVVVTSPVKAHETTTAKSEAASKGTGKAQPASGQNSSGQNSNGQAGTANGNQNGGQGAGKGGGDNGQSQLNAPVMSPKVVQRNTVIAQAPVHGNGRDNGNGQDHAKGPDNGKGPDVKGPDNADGRGQDKTSTAQSRESSPAHRD